jgi:hypothetical protein
MAKAKHKLDFLEKELFLDLKIKHLFRMPYWFLWAAGSALCIFMAIMLFTTISAFAASLPFVGFILGPLCHILLSDFGSVIAVGVIAVVPGYCLYAFAGDIDDFNKNILTSFWSADFMSERAEQLPPTVIVSNLADGATPSIIDAVTVTGFSTNTLVEHNSSEINEHNHCLRL